MGATYTRQSTFTDGDVIDSDLFNNEFDQILAAFASSTGHTHDGTAGEGGPVTGLITDGITFGTNTGDITLTWNGGSADGVIIWKEDEDYFEFSDDLLIATNEKIQFRDTAIYINSSADGQLDLVADTEIQIAATTIDINGNVDVSGTLTVAGAVDFGDAALSNVGAVQLDSIAGDGDTNTSITFSGSDVITVANAGTNQVTFNDGSIAPVTDSDVDLGTNSLRFKDAYIDSATVTGEVAAASLDISGNVDIDGTLETDALSINSTTVTSTAAELNILDGVTATATELNLIDGVTATTAELNILDGVTASAADINLIDGITNGTVIASKAIVTDANIDITGGRNITISGELDAATLDISGNADIDGTLETDALSINGTAVTSTAAELNILDGVTSTAAELNILDGVTASAADINLIDGITNGTVIASKAIITDSNKDITGGRNITISGELDAATLDISGDADIDGTLEADAITIGGVTLAETISDTVGAMVTSNTESGITVTYDDSDNTLDFTVGTLNQDTTGTAAIATTVTITDNENTNENNAIVFTSGGDLDGGNIGLESDGDLKYNPSTGTLSATNISVSGTFSTVNSVTMNANNAVVFEGATADAHETTLTSIDATGDRTISLPNVSGTLPVLAAASATQISSTPEELNILDGVTSTTAELNILDGVTSTTAELNILDGVTSTATELNLLDGVTSTTAELNILDGVTASATDLNLIDGITNGTVIASKAIITDSNKDISGGRNVTISGELDAATLDISGNGDVAGTLAVSGGSSNGVEISQGAIAIKNGGTQSYIDFYCESSNAHYARIQAPAHSAFSGNATITLPSATTTLASTNLAETLTNKTLTSPKINEDVAVTSTATELNLLDGVTSTTAELNILDGVTSTAAELNILDGVTSTAAELNILDGVTSTAAELNILDGVTATAAELNILDVNNSTIGDLSEIGTAADNDVLLAIDTSGGGLKKITRSAIIAGTGSSGDLANVVDDTSPQLGGNLDTNSHNILIDDAHFIGDESGNEQIVFKTTGSAVNYLEITNNATGSNPILAAAGGDTNIGIALTPKGTGEIVIGAGNLNYAGTAITSTGAELNILDGVTSTAAELNILDGVTSTAAELNILDGATVVVGEINALDLGSTAVGTAIASKAMILDSNKDYTGVRNFTLSGELDAGSLDISGNADIDGTLETDALSINGTAVTSTAAELNILDGVTSTAAELNILDGVTSTAAELNILDGVTATAAELNALDGITAVVGELNALDIGSTAVGTAVASKAVILDSNKDYTGMRNLTISGELDAGSLDISGNADIDGTLETDALSINGTAVTSTAAELNALDGITAVVGELNALDIGSTAVGTAVASKAVILDSNKDYTGIRNFTISGEIDAATGDFSGDVDVDGTLEADAITVNGTALNTVIAGVTVANATLAATTTVTDSTANTNFPVVFHDESNALLDDTGALRYNPSTGELLVPKLTVAGTTTTVDTVTMNAENAIIFEGATADAHETTLTIVDPTADRTINLPNQSGTIPLLAAASNTAITSTPAELNILDGVTSTAAELNILDGVTSTAAELNILDGVTSTAAELNILDGVTSTAAELNALDGITAVVGELNALDIGSTAVGTAVASKAVILDSNKDYTGIRNFTVSGELDAATGDFSGDIDVAGTTNLDVVDIDGAVDMASTLTVNDSVTFVSSGASKPVLTIKNTNADANPPSITFQKDSSSPADNDEVANINFYGDDDGGNVAAYANLKVVSTDVSNGSEDGKMTIQTMTAGTLTNTLVLESGATTVSGTLAATGKITADAGIDIDNFNIDGTTIALSSGNMTLDVAGTLFLDADSGDITLKDGGTEFAHLSNSSTDFLIQTAVQDKDILFKGNDGGSAITALTLDMSDAGKAVFNAGATFDASVTAKTDTDTSNSGNVTLDYAANQNFVLTMTGNVTLANPSTEVVGQSGFISFIQDGTGSRVLSVGNQYFCAGGSVIVLSTAANSIDIVPYVVVAAGKICLGAPQLAFADAS
mgnify:CR=1 FL=1